MAKFWQHLPYLTPSDNPERSRQIHIGKVFCA